ncbi:FAD-dependent monooxygenase [Pseudonocardia nematodicida]|uniref:FAD-dependent monooxygenase n=1 Tax=Pseudonocardia nematodicida TaxID=1206997 RepID=A0ABV1KGP7_9PSEU
MRPHRVLISGASIAGPALAWWLTRYGWSVTVVERFDGVREGGQNIDVRGAAREVLRRMDLQETVRAAGTGERGIAFVDDGGHRLAEFGAGTGDTDGATAELEILRGDLADLLVEHTRAGVEYVYGDQIADLDDLGTHVRVGFAHGDEREFDVVVLAEGLSSHTRKLVLPGARISELGMHIAYLTIPRTPADDDWWRVYAATGSRVLWLRPDNHGTLRAGLALRSAVRGLEDLDRADQATVLRRTFAGAGWEIDRVLAVLDDTPFVLDTVGQMRLPSWSRGRVALIGDTAFCSSPVSGMSTSLALVGAYVLAGELTRCHDHRDAFAAYERLMRPYVERAQSLPTSLFGFVYPRTRAGLRVQRTAIRIAGSPAARRVGAVALRGLGSPADEFELPPPP